MRDAFDCFGGDLCMRRMKRDRVRVIAPNGTELITGVGDVRLYAAGDLIVLSVNVVVLASADHLGVLFEQRLDLARIAVCPVAPKDDVHLWRDQNRTVAVDDLKVRVHSRMARLARDHVVWDVVGHAAGVNPALVVQRLLLKGHRRAGCRRAGGRGDAAIPTSRESLSIALLTLCDDSGSKAASRKRSDNGIIF